MPHIDYYFSTISPFAYLAGNRMEELSKKHSCTITYKPLDVMALFGRTGGTPPKDRHPNRIAYRAQDLPRQARKAGMDLNFQPAHWPTNSAPSSYAIIAAQNAGGDVGGLAQAFLRACWLEEKDIAQDDVVSDCLTATGFDPALADSGLLAGAETYAANLEEAVSRGAFGSPFYILDDGQMFWGQDRLEELDLHLQGKL